MIGIASSSAQKHGKRRQNAFQKPPVFNNYAIPQQRSSPPAEQASVEVQQAEVHSEEYVPDRQLQGPFNQGFNQQGDFNQQQQQQNFNQRQQSFRQDSTTALPKEHPTPIPIIRLEKQQSLDGSYKSNYETGNSIQAEETGFVKNIGVPEQEALVQFGSYSYTDPNGELVSVQYTADEGGFRATGSHLPTPPPVPPEVQKGLDIIFESIRQEAERKAKEKKVKNIKLESENYPVDIQEGFDGQPRAQSQGKPPQQARPPFRH